MRKLLLAVPIVGVLLSFQVIWNAWNSQMPRPVKYSFSLTILVGMFVFASLGEFILATTETRPQAFRKLGIGLLVAFATGLLTVALALWT